MPCDFLIQYSFANFQSLIYYFFLKNYFKFQLLPLEINFILNFQVFIKIKQII